MAVALVGEVVVVAAAAAEQASNTVEAAAMVVAVAAVMREAATDWVVTLDAAMEVVAARENVLVKAGALAVPRLHHKICAASPHR